jgi:aldehyde dehydrogenase (NAD+)
MSFVPVGNIHMAAFETRVRDFEAFVQSLIKAVGRMYNADGAGFEKSPELMRIINDQHFARVARLLQDARDKGATVAFGGETRAEDRFVAPTILTKVTEDMLVMQEEIFAPVLPIIPYRDRNEALEIIGRRTKPLALYIYAKERATIDYFLAHTSAGSTVVNHNLIQSGTNPRLPFGGVNHSGIGRIGGEQGFMEMSNPRSVVEQPLGFLDLTFNLPPYSKTYRKLIEKALKT